VVAEHLCFLAKSVWWSDISKSGQCDFNFFQLFINHIKITRSKTLMILLL
jgi:hypothetical protein